jgi:hypothetical protein
MVRYATLTHPAFALYLIHIPLFVFKCEKLYQSLSSEQSWKLKVSIIFSFSISSFTEPNQETMHQN